MDPGNGRTALGRAFVSLAGRSRSAGAQHAGRPAVRSYANVASAAARAACRIPAFAPASPANLQKQVRSAAHSGRMMSTQMNPQRDPLTFETRDPNSAEFWDERYAAQFTPWEAAGLPGAFDVLSASLFAADASAPRRVLIPGCGNGHEIAWLVEHGYDALGIDISNEAIALARRRMPPPLAERHVRNADFFSLADGPFDWIYERAFVAALPPAQWSRWAEQCARLTQPGALLAGYFCIEAAPAEPRRGPPFPVMRDELDLMLGLAFRLVRDIPIDPVLSAPVFAGRERWIVWQRR
jgi:SAM-dependent methyltransferase